MNQCASSFEELLPELESRAKRIAKRFPQPYQQAVAADALSAMYLNFEQAARHGRALTGPNLGWGAALHVRWRSTAVYSRCRGERHPTHSLEAVQGSEHPLCKRLVNVLTTHDEDPSTQAQVKLDWMAFTQTQPPRIQYIIEALARSESKGELARSLHVTAGRLSQLLAQIRIDLMPFFNADLPV